MLGKIIGSIFLAIPFSIIFYLLVGAGTMFICFNKWHRKEQFKRGIIHTPVAVVMGVFCWPWVLKNVLTSKNRKPQSSDEDEGKESLKEMAARIVAADRDEEENFFYDWFRDYFKRPKIDPEEKYSQRVYL